MDNKKNLIESLNTSQILVGLDLGTKTLGVAVSDRLKIIASPLSTIQRNGTKKDLLKLQEILNDYEIEKCAKIANLCGSTAASKIGSGSNVPLKEELMQNLKKHEKKSCLELF